MWLDLETAREQDDPARVMKAVLTDLDWVLSLRFPELSRPDKAELAGLLEVPETALLVYLSRFAALDPRPLVLLFDEADGLVGRAMVSFLTQLRRGYIERASVPFPASVALARSHTSSSSRSPTSPPGTCAPTARSTCPN